ncbi:hypothetical protein REPUB_Repub01dG0095200 [Reevesia pubescens]
MAEVENSFVETINGDCHDFKSILSSSDRDFLVRNNGDQVKIESLKGKKLGLYFSASWCGPCRRFTPKLVEVYSELSPKGDFEIIFVSGDEDEESFNGYFSKMPWLALPFSDSETRSRLDELFKVMGIPHLVLLDQNGKVSTADGVGIIREYGEEGYPFTPEKIQELKDLEEKARTEQSIKTILASRSRDFVVTSDGNKVPVSELEGKTVALYFSVSSYKAAADFTPKLAEVYKKLKENGENFEVVVISLDDEDESFKESFVAPWLALPFKDKICEKLTRYFELSTLPTVVIIGPDGKTLHSNVAEAIEEHGILAYPFTPEKFAELAELENAKEAAQTLESILISGDVDFVIGKDGAKVQVTDLVGKTVLLYFSAHWCPPCRAFTPKLVEAYKTIKAKDEAFEVVFISSDRDQSSFEEYYSEMPWLALPFGDARKPLLSRKFNVRGIPMLITIGPTGKTVTKETRNLIMTHGSDAYPFTEERLKEIEAQYEERAKEEEDEETKADKKEEEDKETKAGEKEEEDKETKADEKEEGNPKEGWVCDGEVCTRAE